MQRGACAMVQLIQQTAFPLCREYLVSAYHGTTTSAEPLFIVRAGLSNPKGLMDAIPFETVLEWLMFEKEVVHLRWGGLVLSWRSLLRDVPLLCQ